MTTDAKTKGSILISRLKYVREVAKEEGLARVLSRLSSEDRSTLEGWLLHSRWYPMDLNLRLDEAIAAELSPGNPKQVFFAMGVASADANLAPGGPHRHFVRESDPHFLLSRAPQIYATYYAAGRRTYEKTGDRAAVLRTFDAESVCETDCLTVVSWHVRAIELCGGRNASVTETQCRARGAPHCEYHCRWD